jgi:ubiquinone biosynthesis protein
MQQNHGQKIAISIRFKQARVKDSAMISVLSAIRDLGRLREISTVLMRHGFGEVVSRMGLGRKKGESQSPGPLSSASESALVLADGTVADVGETTKGSIEERIRLVLQDLGPSFIKLGQIASTRQDVLPKTLVAELKKLQDNVPQVSFESIKQAVEESLGDDLSTMFLWFDEKPLATASIGQVHRARIESEEGELEVVVKVQRPGVGPTVARDLEILHILAALLERTIPETKLYSPAGLVQQFDRSITAELDFTVEAENGERLAQNFRNQPHVRFPKVYRKQSSKRVLTQEFFDGLKVDRAVQEGYSGPLIAKRSVAIVIKMIFEDGFFHADPHPGNILILGEKEDPIVGLIDLGMVGRLSPELRDRTIDLMVAAVRKDAYGVADALYQIGRPTKKIDMREYRSHVALLAEKYLGKPLKEIELSAMLRDLVQGGMKYGIEIPPDFMMVGKSLMTIEGIGKELDPDLDVFTEAQPYFLDLMKQRYSPERLGNELWRGVEQLSRAGYDLPMQAREVLDDLRLGRLTLRTEDPNSSRALQHLGTKVALGLVSSAFVVTGGNLLSKEMWVMGALSLVSGGVLLLSGVRIRS